MNDMDGLSRHIYILIHCYLTQIYRMPNHLLTVMIHLTLVLTHVVSLLPTLLYPLKHIPSFLHFLLFIIPQSTLLPSLLCNRIQPFCLYRIHFIILFVPSKDNTWLSFDSIITFFGSLLYLWST